MPQGGSGFSCSTDHPVWKRIWNLKLPGKVKIFIWRCMHNAIPCMGVLADRHIVTSGQCPLCSTYVESVSHMLFKCRRAKEVWKGLGLHEIIDKLVVPRRSGVETLEAILCEPGHQIRYMEER